VVPCQAEYLPGILHGGRILTMCKNLCSDFFVDEERKRWMKNFVDLLSSIMAALPALPCFSVPALRLPPSQWDLKTWKSQRAPLSYTKLITNAKKHFQKISCNKTGASELSYIFSSKLLLQIF
jgi:hypothetical protein